MALFALETDVFICLLPLERGALEYLSDMTLLQVKPIEDRVLARCEDLAESADDLF